LGKIDSHHLPFYKIDINTDGTTYRDITKRERERGKENETERKRDRKRDRETETETETETERHRRCHTLHMGNIWHNDNKVLVQLDLKACGKKTLKN